MKIEKLLKKAVDKAIGESREELLNNIKGAFLETEEDYADRLYTLYGEAVGAFYADYEPVEYERTYSLINNGDSIFTVEINGLKIVAELDGSRGMTAPHAFMRIYAGGWHGGAVWGDSIGYMGGPDDSIDSEDTLNEPHYWPNEKRATRMLISPYQIILDGKEKWIAQNLQKTFLRHYNKMRF